MTLRRRCAGFSVVELMMATVVLSILLGVAMSASKVGVDVSTDIAIVSYQESRVQTAMSRLSEELAESRINLVSILNFNDGTTANTGNGMHVPAYKASTEPVQRWERLFPQWRRFFASAPYPAGVPNQSAIVYPTARTPQGRFVFAGGQPVWQGIVLWCAHDMRGASGIQLFRYVSYDPAPPGPRRNYATDGSGNPLVRISSITTWDTDASPRITLTDGTVFFRNGTLSGSSSGAPACANFQKLSCGTGNQVHVELDALALSAETDPRADFPPRRVSAVHAECDVYCRN
ncbi:MAG: prepilin-type N-terminal cleavage/methylation domain-containing protein [Planctomycetes bacterium]|nr:prepilin-type N-terminal cleavage/methylation domain-containing protein [Planctomycetota bacterium]